MKKSVAIIVKMAALATVLFALILAGCAPQTGTATKQYDQNWRFVPRIHVDNDSFGTTAMQYNQCSYDQYYDGYWCRIE
jgi:hypothetical protein